MCKKIKNWLIEKLGGYTEEEHTERCKNYEADRKAVFKVATEYFDKYNDAKKIISNLTTVQSELRVDPKFGYTPDNVIEASKAQTMFNLGRAVYPYAKHFVTEDGLYICSVEVLRGTEHGD